MQISLRRSQNDLGIVFLEEQSMVPCLFVFSLQVTCPVGMKACLFTAIGGTSIIFNT